MFNPNMSDKQMEHKKMFVLIDSAEKILDEAKKRIDCLSSGDYSSSEGELPVFVIRLKFCYREQTDEM